MQQALTPCPPWLYADAQRLLNAADQKRLHHALLITGIDGIGKQVFCAWLAEALLCSNRTLKGACGECPACRQVLADAHPDFRKIEPEGANGGIKIDSVRSLVDWLQLTSGQDSYRVALMSSANGLNRHSANSLLKTLEEPADNAVLILGAARIGALPATVRSRCQKITLRMGDQEAAVNWLAQYSSEPLQVLMAAGGGPYAAVRSLNEAEVEARKLLAQAWTDLFLHKGSVGRIADSIAKLESGFCLAMFAKWCVLAAKQGHHVPVEHHETVIQLLKDTQNRLNSEQWFSLYDRLLQLHRSDSASFKTQTVLEGFFADTRLIINGKT